MGVTARVTIRNLSGIKLVNKIDSGAVISFDVKARMDEKESRSGLLILGFGLSVGTKPNVAKFEVEGIATLEGKDEEVRKMLEVDPETQTPRVFQKVYQHIFMSMYLLATLIDAPYPPPNLLGSNQQQESILEMAERIAASKRGRVAERREASASPVEKPSQPAPAPASTIRQEETEQTVEAGAETQEESVA